MDLAARFEAVRTEALARFAAAGSAAAVEEARIAYLGRSGVEKELTDAFAAAAPEDKRRLGQPFNQLKQALRQALADAQARLATVVDDAPIDLTLPAAPRRTGSIHPLSKLGAEVEDVFRSMGYQVVEGPQVEFDEFNFGRLNIPADHPARDHQDTFWLEAADGQPRLLRTHTSSVQSRVYRMVGDGRLKPPFRRVVVGRVFRRDAVDATHDVTFTQVEGFVVDRGITVAHMVGAVQTMISAVLARDDVEVRLRPSFFPFVEPGFEVDVRMTKADPSSRFSRWVELLGCGLIHPRVLEMGSPELAGWQGFAFGMGLERLCMVRHGITDIRVFNGADLRALRQFGN
jgi:phenylalanyl-tRNA synthetase alpha chain